MSCQDVKMESRGTLNEYSSVRWVGGKMSILASPAYIYHT